MKNYMIFLLFVCSITLFGTVTVMEPNGGESIPKGSQIEITWYDNISEAVKIELYQNDVYHSDIATSTDSDGSYLWDMPNEISGSNFKIKVLSTVIPILHNDISDDYFTIGLIEVI